MDGRMEECTQTDTGHFYSPHSHMSGDNYEELISSESNERCRRSCRDEISRMDGRGMDGWTE